MATRLVRPAGPSGPAGRTAPRWRLIVASALVVALAATAAVAVRTSGSRADVRRGGTPAVVARARGAEAHGIEGLQRRLRAAPEDRRAWAALGAAYVQRARITGDPTLYPKAERALRRSLALGTTANVEAMIGMSALASARHDFATALRWGDRARAINPHDASVHGVTGDALIELGRYPEAFDAFQRMLDLRPGLSSYARASYAWELQGNIPNAIEAMELALEAAASPADDAFAAYHIGELHWNAGRTTEASRWYRQSAAHDPTFVPALQGLAKTEVARGNLDTAIDRYTDVVARLPLPQYVIELAEVAQLAGKDAVERQQLELLGVQERLLRANGVDVDIDQALFRADHGVDLAAGLAAAQSEWRTRKSIFVADALAWSLYANGRHREALTYATKALRLGTRNALFYFHKGMIERALGRRDAARRDLRQAMRINPHFSFVWSSRVPRILKELS